MFIFYASLQENVVNNRSCQDCLFKLIQALIIAHC